MDAYLHICPMKGSRDARLNTLCAYRAKPGRSVSPLQAGKHARLTMEVI
jgi:hypothetical protein